MYYFVKRANSIANDQNDIMTRFYTYSIWVYPVIPEWCQQLQPAC